MLYAVCRESYIVKVEGKVQDIGCGWIAGASEEKRKGSLKSLMPHLEGEKTQEMEEKV